MVRVTVDIKGSLSTKTYPEAVSWVIDPQGLSIVGEGFILANYAPGFWLLVELDEAEKENDNE